MGWFTQFFNQQVRTRGANIVGFQPWGDAGLTRKYIGYFEGFLQGDHYEYKCKCGTLLSEGPSGAMSVNAVCKECKINYGCLPGYFGDQS